MGRLWIKVCGVRTREAIDAAARAGADAVGFVFHEASPRNLAIAEAIDLGRAVPSEIDRVAVFLHPAQGLVDAVIAAIRPDWIQADAADLEKLRLPNGSRTLPVLRSGQALPSPLPPRCLLEGALSGMGERADWTEAARVAAVTQVVLAGGLDATNIAEALHKVHPFGVDVSSGVESSRGVKDVGKIREFIRAARRAESDRLAEESR